MAGKHVVSFEVDRSELFDRLSEIGQDGWSLLGQRLVGALLAEPSFGDAVGMAFYGVTIADTPAQPTRIEA